MKQEDNWDTEFLMKMVTLNELYALDNVRNIKDYYAFDHEHWIAFMKEVKKYVLEEKQKSFNSALEEIEKIIDKMAKDYVLTLEERKLADKIGSLDICEADERAYLKALDDVKKLLKLKK